MILVEAKEFTLLHVVDFVCRRPVALVVDNKAFTSAVDAQTIGRAVSACDDLDIFTSGFAQIDTPYRAMIGRVLSSAQT